jgi:O-antigen/teichoic acid export membrane protein
MLLDKYKGNQLEVYISWFLLCLINTYNLFSLYYDALLQGKGLIKKSKQIQIVGQAIYLFVAVLFIMLGNSLIAIVSAQLVSVIIVRWLSYRSFFTKKMKINLIRAKARSKNEIFSAIYPNAIKIGLTSLGSFMVQKSSIIIGSLFISLQDLASYGISMQFIVLIAVFSGIYLATFQSKIAQLRIEKNITEIKQLYLKGKLILLFTYILAGSGLVILGSWALKFMDSQTQILPVSMLVVLLVISFLESNHSLAGSILLSNNEVPFFKASMLAGIVTVVLLLLMFSLTDLGIWTMILAPGLAHLYNNWKWPYEVNKQLEISFFDNNKAFVNIKKSIKNGNRKRTII